MQLKIKLKSEGTELIKKDEVFLLDVSLIRKIFKPSLIPTISDLLSKPADQKSKFEIRLILEFEESFYNKVC